MIEKPVCKIIVSDVYLLGVTYSAYSFEQTKAKLSEKATLSRQASPSLHADNRDTTSWNLQSSIPAIMENQTLYEPTSSGESRRSSKDVRGFSSPGFAKLLTRADWYAVLTWKVIQVGYYLHLMSIVRNLKKVTKGGSELKIVQ